MNATSIDVGTEQRRPRMDEPACANEMIDLLASLLLYAANEASRLRMLGGATESASERAMIESQATHLEAMCRRGTAVLARAKGD